MNTKEWLVSQIEAQKHLIVAHDDDIQRSLKKRDEAIENLKAYEDDLKHMENK